MMYLNNQWNKCLKQIKKQLNDDVKYLSIYKKTNLISIDDNFATVIVKDNYHKKILEVNKKMILKIMQDVFEIPIEDVEFLMECDINMDDLDFYYSLTNLNDVYTFNNFIVGKSNRTAQNAALAISLNAGRVYNPLVIYGNHGLGKTHLLYAIGNHIVKRNHNNKVLYMSAIDFYKDFMDTLPFCNKHILINKFKNLDILLFDDFQYILSNKEVLEVFFIIYNYLIINGKQIVIATNKNPKECFKELGPRNYDLLRAGLLAKIERLDDDLVQNLIKVFLKRRNRDIYKIDKRNFKFISDFHSESVRDIEGAISTLDFYLYMKDQDIKSIDIIKDFI